MSTDKERFLESMVQLGIRARQQPMACNMFEKPCDLLTCHQKHTCLWTKEEAEKIQSKGESGLDTKE
jgi:hypothetical protein